jgi:hypothetical protein
LVGKSRGLILKYYHCIRLEELRKTTKNLNVDRLSPGSIFEPGTFRVRSILTTQPRRSVSPSENPQRVSLAPDPCQSINPWGFNTQAFSQYAYCQGPTPCASRSGLGLSCTPLPRSFKIHIFVLAGLDATGLQRRDSHQLTQRLGRQASLGDCKPRGHSPASLQRPPQCGARPLRLTTQAFPSIFSRQGQDPTLVPLRALSHVPPLTCLGHPVLPSCWLLRVKQGHCWISTI